MPKEPGLSADEIEQETAVALPERDAMSLVDGGVKLLPISTAIVPTPSQPIDRIPEDPTGQGA
ncbi:MAG TPA: hypothetical protein VFA31_00100 [Candidatus Polarisedimenticolia bacterium]|jgi:hypothetical protein|nr:hypothetical protein [Candidatus Polarisedimenticolia bacterium]